MNSKKQCNYCHSQFDSFTPYRGGSAVLPRNMILLEVIGSDVDQFGCPVCGAHDRERHLKLYFDELKLDDKFPNARILHFAPENHFLHYIQSYGPELHIKADLLSSSMTVLSLNIEAIPYDDHSFDIVIANHILEHVSNIELALSEINRVLKPDGIAILQTPFSRKLKNTLEDPGIDTDALRLAFYGQEDHVRLFGQDIFERFSAFLQPEIVSHAETLGRNNTNMFGVNPDEPLFLFRHKTSSDKFIALPGLPGLRTEEEIKSTWVRENPLVSIQCLTYNHENYIASTIESFLMQQTDFPFEIVIGDDCSTDSTLEIIHSYASRYPTIIRIIPGTRNVGPHANFIRAMNTCHGDYVALCDGDDYWTDSRKLQKQIDVLENDPDCVITYGAVQAFDENGIVYEYMGGALCDLTMEQLQHSHPINSLTVCFRNHLVSFPPESFTTGHGDLFLWSLLGHYGHGRYIDAILPSRYRIHSGGVHSSKAKHEQYAMLIETNFSLYHYYKRIGETSLAAYFCNQVQRAASMVYQLTDVQQARNVLDQLLRKIKLKTQDQYEFDEAELTHLLNADNILVSAEKSEKSLGVKKAWVLAYQTWINKHSLQEIDAQLLAERMILKWQSRPSVHLVMPVQSGEQGWLADTIDSLGSQMYQNWQLTVVADFPSPDPIFEQLQELQWIEASSDASPAEAVNHAISSRMADWVAFVKPGIRFEPHYLLACADYINVRPQWKLIYTDSDRINANNERVDPEFKPDFNLDMLRSTAYMGQILVNRDALMKAGGASCLTGAESYDLALRLLDKFGEPSIGHISDVLYHSPQLNKPEFNEPNGREALKQHLQRNEIRADVTEGYLPNTYRVIYEHEQVPLVSIIIPTKDKLEFFQPCITSLLEKTMYANYEVIVVDNQSTDPDVLEYYSELRINHADKIKILEYPHAFNFSAICNFAAAEAVGDYLLLLNNDTQIIQDDWLDRMVSYGQRKDVGIVGARLIYPETGKIQHAGVVLGMTGPADHPFNGILSIDEPGYMGRALIDQNYSAVTAACLLIRASVYKQVGGMDDVRFKVLFNDVDLCLKVGELGYKIIWTPYVTAVHYGSTSINSSVIDYEKLALSLARAKQEREAMFERWLPKLANDPAYNRHLSLVRTDYQVESNVVIDWDTHFHDRPRILGIPLPGGSGEYRVISPFKALGYAGLAQCCIIQSAEYHKTRVLTVVELERAKPDTLLVQAAITDIHLEALRLHSRFNKDVFKVFALDDLINNPPPKSSFAQFAFKDAKPRLRAALAECDRLIVSTQPLADLCASMIGDIRVIPNHLSDKLWGGLVSQRRQGKKPRVGWAGGQQHQGDLGLIASVVKETANEVDWIFFGMCLDELKPYVKEIHDFVVSVDDYPAKLASLNLDLAVAPLEMHPFNEAKSNLRLLEYGILGWPVVCTDILPYHNAPVKRVPNDPNAWIEAIRERIDDLDAAAREGEVLRQWVLENYMLENHIEEWMSALTR